jgi:hypothetical protein
MNQTKETELSKFGEKKIENAKYLGEQFIPFNSKTKEYWQITQIF